MSGKELTAIRKRNKMFREWDTVRLKTKVVKPPHRATGHPLATLLWLIFVLIAASWFG